MSGNLRLYNSGGYVELQAPSNATSQTLVLPTDSIQPGLVHIATESFSGVSSVAFDNAFSSSYDNYKILINALPSTACYAVFVLRSAGSDVTGGYNGSSAYISITTGGYTAQNWGTSSANIQLAYMGSNGENFIDLSVSNPYLTKRTKFSFMESYADGTPVWGADTHTVSSSYDGIRIYPASGTMTGSIRIYGYRNS